jgi:hypothetical protein
MDLLCSLVLSSNRQNRVKTGASLEVKLKSNWEDGREQSHWLEKWAGQHTGVCSSPWSAWVQTVHPPFPFPSINEGSWAATSYFLLHDRGK